jgi:Reverse transcriptase (RNA-dependent DNA polymerase)
MYVSTRISPCISSYTLTSVPSTAWGAGYYTDPEVDFNFDGPLFNFSNNPVTVSEIVDTINLLEPKKTSDFDGLSMFFVSKFSLTLATPLMHILNCSFNTGIFPSQLKIAKIIPIHKSGSRCDMNNYRPISLLSVFSKIFEKILCNRLTFFLESNNLLSQCQFGFRKNNSTVYPLIKFLNYIAKASSEKKHCIAIFCDLKKASDSCDHSILLKKMYKLGIRGIKLSWFKNYLSNRKQFVSINGFSSSLLDILIGVPQGSVLGPLLFLIYVNDVNLCTRNSLFCYLLTTQLFWHLTLILTNLFHILIRNSKK